MLYNIHLLALFFNNISHLEYPCDTIYDKRSKLYYAVYPSVAATFPGGISNFQNYLVHNSNQKYINEKSSYPMELFINKNGFIMSPKIIGGKYCPNADRAMIKILLAMPKWIPAQCNGKPITSKFYYKITY